MPAISLDKQLNKLGLSQRAQKELRNILKPFIESHQSTAAKYDALVTAYNASLAKIDVLTTKMNADTGINDTDYATNFAATNPGVGGAATAVAALIVD